MTFNRIIPSISPQFAERLKRRKTSGIEHIWALLDEVCDPELPTVTLWDLGVLQNIQPHPHNNNQFEITMTPTYSGCPAVETMQTDLLNKMNQAGYKNTLIKIELSPAWNTEMISPEGKCQLQKLNIAPPHPDEVVCCPNCGSPKTRVISQFGSTACKALYQCSQCTEAFDYFKHFE